MDLNETLQMKYEEFEADLRRLDQLINELELWSDEFTVNHKKEEVRLPEYMEINQNFEEHKQNLVAQMNELSQEEVLKEKMNEAREYVAQRLADYQQTEEVIHDWIRAIKNPYMLLNNTSALQKYREYIESIINA